MDQAEIEPVEEFVDQEVVEADITGWELECDQFATDKPAIRYRLNTFTPPLLTREAYIRQQYPEETAQVAAQIARGETLLFIPNDIREVFLEDTHEYVLDIYGITVDGMKTKASIKGISVCFDVRVPHDMDPDKLVTDLLNEIKHAYSKSKVFEPLPTITIIHRFPLLGYREEPIPFLHIVTVSMKARKAIIECFEDRFDMYSDDRYHYFRKFARETGVLMSEIMELEGYESFPVGRPSHRVDLQILTVSVNGVRSFINPFDPQAKQDQNIETKRNTPNLLRDRLLVMTWDIETFSGRKLGEVPDAKYVDDVVFMICMTLHWKDNPKPLHAICLVDVETEPDSRWDTVIVDRAGIIVEGQFLRGAANAHDPDTRQANMIRAFAYIVEAWKPDIVTGFNDGQYDWPFIFGKMKHLAMSPFVFQHMGANIGTSNSRGLPEPEDGSDEDVADDAEKNKTEQKRASTSVGWHRIRFIRRQDVKISAESSQKIQLPKIPGFIAIDTRIAFMKMYPSSDFSSLNFFLKENRIDCKEDMPYQRMFDIYEEANALLCGNASVKANVLQRSRSLMRHVAKYCIVDAQRCQELLVKRNVINEQREVASLSFVSLGDCFNYAGGMKVSNVLNAHAFRRGILCQNSHPNMLLDEAKFPGAYVFPPIKGPECTFPVTGLDFASLYPSLIMTYNLSPERFVFCNAEKQATANLKAVLDARVTGKKNTDLEQTRLRESARLQVAVIETNLQPTTNNLQIAKVGLANAHDAWSKSQHSGSKNPFDEEVRKRKVIVNALTTEKDKLELDRLHLMSGAYVKNKLATFRESQMERIKKVQIETDLIVREKSDEEAEFLARTKDIYTVDFDYGYRAIHGHFVRHEGVTEQIGLFPSVLIELFTKRKNMKKRLKQLDKEIEKLRASGAETEGHADYVCLADLDFEQKSIDAKQKALKVTMNTFYGETGNSRSCFFLLQLAGGVTTAGQNAIRFAQSVVEKHGYTVKYGDTDSLYITCPVETYKDIPKPVDENNEPLRGVARKPYCEALIWETIKSVNIIRDIVNTELIEFSGWTRLSMAYEEILYPSIWAGKKKYLGYEHQNQPNFDHPTRFLRGISIRRRGQTEFANEIICKYIQQALDIGWQQPDAKERIQTLAVDIIIDAARTAYELFRALTSIREENPLVSEELVPFRSGDIRQNILDFYNKQRQLTIDSSPLEDGPPCINQAVQTQKAVLSRSQFGWSFWNLSSFSARAAYRPTKHNPRVNLFVEQMGRLKTSWSGSEPIGFELPLPGERFDYIIQDESAVDFTGKKSTSKIGSLMAFLHFAEKQWIMPNVTHYLGFVCTSLARFINYEDMFAFDDKGKPIETNELLTDAELKKMDEQAQKNATKFLQTKACDGLRPGTLTRYKQTWKRIKPKIVHMLTQQFGGASLILYDPHVTMPDTSTLGQPMSGFLHPIYTFSRFAGTNTTVHGELWSWWLKTARQYADNAVKQCPQLATDLQTIWEGFGRIPSKLTLSRQITQSRNRLGQQVWSHNNRFLEKQAQRLDNLMTKFGRTLDDVINAAWAAEEADDDSIDKSDIDEHFIGQISQSFSEAENNLINEMWRSRNELIAIQQAMISLK
jgi:DNA polymerase elongation subunit (family B)